MLERYFVRPSNVDRDRACWLAVREEKRVEWMHGNGYAAHPVLSRVPIFCNLGDFA